MLDWWFKTQFAYNGTVTHGSNGAVLVTWDPLSLINDEKLLTEGDNWH